MWALPLLNWAAVKVGKDDNLAQGWAKLSEVTNQMATIHGELAQSEMESFELSLKDYILWVRSAKEVLENRVAALQKLQNLEADSKAKHERLSKNTSAGRAAALTAELQQAQTAETDQKNLFENLSKEVKAELENFKEKKGKELRKVLSEFVRQNMNAQLRVVGLWKEILADLEEQKRQQV